MQEDVAQQIALPVRAEPAAKKVRCRCIPAPRRPRAVENVGGPGDGIDAREDGGRNILGCLALPIRVVLAGKLEKIDPLGARQAQPPCEPRQRAG